MMTSCGREWKKLRQPVKVSYTSCTVWSVIVTCYLMQWVVYGLSRLVARVGNVSALGSSSCVWFKVVVEAAQ